MLDKDFNAAIERFENRRQLDMTNPFLKALVTGKWAYHEISDLRDTDFCCIILGVNGERLFIDTDPTRKKGSKNGGLVKSRDLVYSYIFYPELRGLQDYILGKADRAEVLPEKISTIVEIDAAHHIIGPTVQHRYSERRMASLTNKYPHSVQIQDVVYFAATKWEIRRYLLGANKFKRHIFFSRAAKRQ